MQVYKKRGLVIRRGGALVRGRGVRANADRWLSCHAAQQVHARAHDVMETTLVTEKIEGGVSVTQIWLRYRRSSASICADLADPP